MGTTLLSTSTMKSTFLILAILLCWASAQNSGKRCRKVFLRSKYGRAMSKAACRDPSFKAKLKNFRTCGKCSSEVRCSRGIERVCGSDGKKYGNKCLLGKASCTDRKLKMVSMKRCEGK